MSFTYSLDDLKKEKRMKKFLSLMLCAALPLCAFAAHAEMQN